MEVNQRIKELREMFLQLSEIILEEIGEGKSVQSSETFMVMKEVQAELEKLEQQRRASSN